MSPALPSRLQALLQATRRRVFGIVVGLALPLWLVSGFVAWRKASVLAAAMTAVGLVTTLALAGVLARRRDARGLLRQLDARCPELEDSAALLIADPTPQEGLAVLQLRRLQARVVSLNLPELRPAWPRGALFAAWLAGAAAMLAIEYAPQFMQARAPAAVAASAPAGDTAAGVAETRLSIEPPAYTGLSRRTESSMDVQAPVGSQLSWSLRLSAPAQAVALVRHDGQRVELRSSGGRWQAEQTLQESMLYRLEVDGSAIDKGRLFRIDALADRPPEVQVLAPEKTLTVLTAEQPEWQLRFDARDDYGLSNATLNLTLAQGSGENIEVHEQTLELEGRGDAKHREYTATLKLKDLKFEQGNDLIARLVVSDNRQPEANRARSASFILRWPAETSTESEGMDGFTQKTLPAYFRSQRQIIIDSEALIAERGSLAAEAFAERSDSIGVDQKILRLRYGQFLGEEFEPGAGAEAHDADEAAHTDEAQDQGKAEGEAATQQSALEKAHGHDEGSSEPANAGFGRSEDVLHEFGHAHDIAEAATLLDPKTREILRAALNEMWQAEAELRVGAPDRALPYEYKALDYIKQVQQATRIYLSRTGLDLPQIDETRRLTGKREGLVNPNDALMPTQSQDAVVRAAFDTLAAGGTPDWTAFDAWLELRRAQLPDALGLVAAANRLRREPDCAECRDSLRRQLWPLLPATATQAAPRRAADAAGAAYLQALNPAADASEATGPEARP